MLSFGKELSLKNQGVRYLDYIVDDRMDDPVEYYR